MVTSISERSRIIFSPIGYAGRPFTCKATVNNRTLLVSTTIPKTGDYSCGETLHTRNGIKGSQFYTLEPVDPDFPDSQKWVLNGNYPLFHDLLHAVSGTGTLFEARALLATFILAKEGVNHGLIDLQKFKEAVQRIQGELEQYNLTNLLATFNSVALDKITPSSKALYSPGLTALLEDYTVAGYQPNIPRIKDDLFLTSPREIFELLAREFEGQLAPINEILNTFYGISCGFKEFTLTKTSITVLPQSMNLKDESGFIRFEQGDELLKNLYGFQRGLTAYELN